MENQTEEDAWAVGAEFGPCAARPKRMHGLTKALAIMGSVAAVTVALIYLSYRVLAFYESCCQVHVALGIAYVVGMSILIIAFGFFATRSLERYYRLRTVDHFQALAVQVRRERAGSQQEEALRKMIFRFLADHNHTGPVEIREAINRLRVQLNKHADAAQAVDELEEYVLRKLDKRADAIISQRAAQVAVGTALAYGVFDFFVVAWQGLAMIQDISSLYTGRPGALGTLRLLRRAMLMAVVAEVAEEAAELLTDAAAGRLAARLGARVGQGLGNGYLMLRFGDAVKRQCRPIALPPGRPSATILIEETLALVTGKRKSAAVG
jgi:putative membrane protein